MNTLFLGFFGIDEALTAWINSFAGHAPLVDGAICALSASGPYLMVALIILRWWSKTCRVAQRHLALRCGLATSLSVVINQLIILFVHRQRPYDVSITRLIAEKSADPSFPSDHAAVVFAIAASLLLRRDKWSVLFVSFACFVSLSRVYVGTHFVSDVVGGAIVGVVAGSAVAWFYRESWRPLQKLIEVA